MYNRGKWREGEEELLTEKNCAGLHRKLGGLIRWYRFVLVVFDYG